MPFSRILLLISTLILFTSVLSHIEDDHVCNHNNLDFEAEELEIEEDMSRVGLDDIPLEQNDNNEDNGNNGEEENGRLLASQTYNKMRIQPDYTSLNSASSSFRNYIMNELVPPVLSYISSALRVKYPVAGKIQLDGKVKSICGKTVPSDLRGGVRADYYVMFGHYADGTATVANSKYCFLATGTKRPLIGHTEFNRNQFFPSKGDILGHEKNTYVLIHEMMHSLGFSNNLYNFFIDNNAKPRKGHIITKVIGGLTHTVLDLPSLTARLRNYYGCSSVPGAILENTGGDGTAVSHFERKFFVYDVMSSGTIHGRRVSEFTLAFFEGTGWYAPDYSYAEPFFFGKGKGCNFINQKCSPTKLFFDDFCIGSNRGCAPHGRSGGRCAYDREADGCSYVVPVEDLDCENPDGVDFARFPNLEAYGRTIGSKCFEGDLSTRSSSSQTTFCFKYYCTGSGTSTKLQVQVGSKSLTCNHKGSMAVEGYHGSIQCPDPLEFCTTVGKKYCPRNCMGRGYCQNNKCVCNRGFTGVDCGLYI